MKNRIAGIGWIVALLMILAFFYIVAFGNDLVKNWPASWWGIFVLVLAYAVSAAATNRLNPLALAAGEDGRLSLSKAQTLFWTFIVLYAYAALYANDVKYCTLNASTCAAAASTRAASAGAPANNGVATPAPANANTGNNANANANAASAAPQLGANALIPINFPSSVLLLLGFSVTSLIAAAGITRSQIANGAKKQVLPQDDLSLKWLVQSDDGRVDLTRFQVVLWTLVAAGAFISDAQLMIAAGGLQLWLPDVGSALVLLMGLGQAAYVGGKLVVTPKPQIYQAVPSHAPPGTTVTVSGAGFGATQTPTSFLFVDGMPVTAATWSDGAITFAVPNAPPGGGAWPKAVEITVIVGASTSAAQPFSVP